MKCVEKYSMIWRKGIYRCYEKIEEENTKKKNFTFENMIFNMNFVKHTLAFVGSFIFCIDIEQMCEM